jgi:hypothetical protein
MMACRSALDRERATVLLDCEQHSGWTHYAIVRSDLTHGQQCAQLVHAAGESTPTRVVPNTVAVALHARDELHLGEIAAALARGEIPHVVIAECDGERMAIGVEPTQDRDRVRKVLSSLPLAR